jgi:alpha-beta hydrolase superfamily lysophospholipase
MSIALIVLLLALLFLIFVSLILFVVGPFMLLQPYRRTEEYYRRRTALLHPSQITTAFEQITLHTAEGIPLSLWLLKVAGPASGTVIYLHGVSESKIAGLPIAGALLKAGWTVVLYDARRHGDSGGSFCTYGFYEKHDVSTIVSWLRSRSDTARDQIALFGSSMGAAVAIQAAARDRRIAGVIAESGFASLRTVFDEYQKRMIKLPFHYLRNVVIRRSERLAHFKAAAVSPLAAIAHVRAPILITHGTDDSTIGHRYSRQLFEAAGEPRQLLLVPHARHDNMWDAGGDRYRAQLTDFLAQLVTP